MRRYQRIADTQDLVANLRSNGRRYGPSRVLNLSHGGMLVAGGELRQGDLASFEIEGPYFRYAGLAEVAHHTNGATGLRFVRWQGQADRTIRALIASRLRQGRSADPARLRRPAALK